GQAACARLDRSCLIDRRARSQAHGLIQCLCPGRQRCPFRHAHRAKDTLHYLLVETVPGQSPAELLPVAPGDSLAPGIQSGLCDHLVGLSVTLKEPLVQAFINGGGLCDDVEQVLLGKSPHVLYTPSSKSPEL